VRKYVCLDCSELNFVDTKTGPLPLRCPRCNPHVKNRPNEKKYQKLRSQQAALASDLLWHFSHASWFQEPGKPAIVEGVKALNRARGQKDTRLALLRLAGACLAWCLDLTPEVQAEKKRLDVQMTRQISKAENKAA
jgi:DNA-directed RNA polymerase subunit RPC12/RpoP